MTTHPCASPRPSLGAAVVLFTPSRRRFGAPVRRLFRAVAGAFALVAATVAAAPAFAAPEDNVVLQWNDAVLQAIRETRPAPTVVARAFAVVHTAMYDAWAPYDERAVGTQLGHRLRRPVAERTLANKEEAISYAAYRAATDLFPTRAALFTDLMRSLGYDPAYLGEDVRDGAGVGNLAARVLLEFRHRDGSNQLGDLNPGAYSDYTGYRPVNTPDLVVDVTKWQPLRVPNGQGGFTVQSFATPHWSRVTPFALRRAAQFRPEPPPPANSEAFREQVREAIAYSAGLTDTQKTIAEYWADGPATETPPGHWMLFARFVSARDGHTLDQDVKLFFALGNALLDASIVCWDAKRFYDCVRPITAIRTLYAGKQIRAWGGPGQGTQLIDGKDWRPYQPATFVTPPFPEFTSGHSLFSSASSVVLRLFTGSNVFGYSTTIAAGSSRIEPGLTPAAPVTLSWATFTDAADEAGLSRCYGGIHFRDADLVSRELGLEVGALVWRQANAYFNGRPGGSGRWERGIDWN